MNDFSHPSENSSQMNSVDHSTEGLNFSTLGGSYTAKTMLKLASAEQHVCFNNGGPVQNGKAVGVSELVVNGATEHCSSPMAMSCEAPSPENKSRTHIESEYFAEMRTQCTKAINLSVDYLQGIAKHRVFPQVEPGYLRPLLPEEAPLEPEPWEQIFSDVDKLLMPGVTHWNHPHFHAYLAAANSYPALCADIISTSIGGIGFTWASSPVSTELEVVMLDWLAKLLKLPEFFLSHTEGGGVIQGTSSESTFVSLLAARNVALEKYLRLHPKSSKFEILEKLVGYHSDQAHASVERAGLLSLLRFRALPCNQKFELDGQTLRRAVEEDVANGLIPFYCAATLGTTATCSYDRLPEIGPICQEYDMWLHVDAAYAGSALICPEFHRLMPGLEYISSLAFNPHKWLLMNFDLSIVWLKNAQSFVKAFTVDASYLQHAKLGKMPDFRNWHIPFGRRFRSLKIWFVIRAYGVRGIQNYIRNHVKMAHYLEHLLVSDGRFEIVGEVTLGLVCFRIKVTQSRKQILLK
uniref:Aromatic-L-amino-acid decarboxylase n=1 Tax=Schistocephalus solidus TaxID=70667 RepID=A0A0X3P1L0_SCHSO